MPAVLVPPTEKELSKNVRVIMGVLGPFFHASHVDQMLIFEDVWVIATTQTARSAKYGRFDKTSLVQYDPGW